MDAHPLVQHPPPEPACHGGDNPYFVAVAYYNASSKLCILQQAQAA